MQLIPLINIPAAGTLARFNIWKKKFAFALLCCHVVFLTNAQSNLNEVATRYLDNLYNKSLFFDTSRLEVIRAAPEVADSESGWKEWKTVDNFSFGQNRGALPMIADVQSLHPYFKDKIAELIRACKASGITLVVVETYRTHAKQSEYYAMGKKYTRTVGGSSKHQYGLAADVVPLIDSVPVWNNARLWRKIGIVGERLGLRWGGRWRVPYDPAHFEWSGGVTSYQLAKGLLPKIPVTKLDSYPCIEEDVAKLKSYWDAWEAEQSVIAKNPLMRSDDHWSRE